MKIGGRVRLSDLRPISQHEFDTACRICEIIRQTEESRASYIEEHGLDPDIALPAGLWAEPAKGVANNFYDTYRFVITPKFDVINRLRFYSQYFEGDQLFSSAFADGKGSVNPVPDNFDEMIEQLMPTPDYWVYRYIAINHYVPSEIITKPPKLLGEIGWDVNGSTVNRETCVHQELLNLLYEAGIIDWLRKKSETSDGVNILEIGAGYGGLAYYLKHVLPRANYYICDLPEALLFSSLYLAITCPDYRYTIYSGTDKSILCENDAGFKFIPNFMFGDLVAANVKIDLTINTASFSEMTEKQVRYYAQNLSYMLGDTGILFERNSDGRAHGHIYCKLYLPEYFMFRRAIKPKSFVKVIEARADVWANRRISDVLRPVYKVPKWQILIPWLLYKIYRIVRITRFAPALFEFFNSSPRLKSFLCRILR